MVDSRIHPHPPPSPVKGRGLCFPASGAFASAWSPDAGRRPRSLLAFAVVSIRFLVSLDASLVSREPSHLLLDRTGKFLGEVPGSHEAWGFWPVPDQLPDKVVITTLETEDRNFSEHSGVHFPSIARAAWQNLKNGRVISGASTIPMQLARLQHPKSRTLFAKLQEAAEAMLLIHRFGHDEVLHHYLTIAPYGNRCHGVVRASRLYFDKPMKISPGSRRRTWRRSRKQPGRMSPWTTDGHRLALDRARRILRQLHARQVITDEDLRIALNSDLKVVPRPSGTSRRCTSSSPPPGRCGAAPRWCTTPRSISTCS